MLTTTTTTTTPTFTIDDCDRYDFDLTTITTTTTLATIIGITTATTQHRSPRRPALQRRRLTRTVPHHSLPLRLPQHIRHLQTRLRTDTMVTTTTTSSEPRLACEGESYRHLQAQSDTSDSMCFPSDVFGWHVCEDPAAMTPVESSTGSVRVVGPRGRVKNSLCCRPFRPLSCTFFPCLVMRLFRVVPSLPVTPTPILCSDFTI